MRRFWTFAVLCSALLTACKIEQTPERFIDNLETPASEVEASREELTARLLSIAGALERSDQSALASALSPTSSVFVIGLEPGRAGSTPAGIPRGLLARVGEAEVDAENAVVNVAPQNDVAWFRVNYLVVHADADAESREEVLRFSGVFVRMEGEWRLAQGHLSSISPTPQNQVEDDTPAGGG